MSASTIERVALAILNATGDPVEERIWQLALESHRALESEFGESYTNGSTMVGDALKRARAAIEVMREPTEAMAEAGDAQIPGMPNDTTSYARASWQAMISAALSENEGEA